MEKEYAEVVQRWYETFAGKGCGGDLEPAEQHHDHGEPEEDM